MLAHTIDANGYMLEPIIVTDSIKDGDKWTDGNTVIITRCPDGFYKPQWTGTVWMDAEAPTAAEQLASAQQAQKAFLNQSFNEVIGKGFSSPVSETDVTYAIDPIAMGKWSGTMVNINSGLLTSNIIVKDIDGNKVTLTPDQFKQMAMDGFNFYNTQEQHLWSKEDDVASATSIDEVVVIGW